MDQNNCMPRLTFILIIIIICSSTFFYNLGNRSRTNKEIIRIIKEKEVKNDSKDKNILNYIKNKYDIDNHLIKNVKNIKNIKKINEKINQYETNNMNKKNNINETNNLNKTNSLNETKNVNDELVERDRRVIYDPIKEPTRRLPRHIFNKDSIKRYINIPSRGYPDNYQLVGLLSRNADEKFLQLYGRQKYPGASQWEYYVRGKDLSGLETKIPISIHNDQEIYDNDEVDVPLLDSNKGKFKAQIYKIDTLKYNPYVF